MSPDFRSFEIDARVIFRERLSKERARIVERKSAAVAVILSDDPREGPGLLLIRRAKVPTDPWSGHVALPGGRADPTDADLLGTAIRETKEEAGIDLSDEAWLGCLTPLQARARGELIDLWVHPQVFFLPERPRISTSVEVEQARWIQLAWFGDQLRARTIFDERRQSDLPALELDGFLLWGLSLKILRALFGVAGWPMAVP